MPEETDELRQGIAYVWQVVKRRRWWILSSFGVVAIATVALAFVLPAEYRSEATILVEQQQVPDRYVTPTTTADLLQMLQPMTQSVLSRARLLQIITDLGLYKSEKSRLGPDELVQLMRKNITIEPLIADGERRKANAFKIAYSGSDPRSTPEVVSRIVSLFVDENLRNLAGQAEGTKDFLAQELDSARASLEQQERRVRDFKMAHLGELPQDQGMNLQILAGLQSQMQSTEATLGRARQQQVYLESLLAQYRSLAPKAGGEDTGLTRIAAVEHQLTELRTKRAELVAHYTPEHPDVVNIDHQITQTQALLDVIKKSQKAAPADAPTDASAFQVADGDDPATAQLKSQLKANQLEISNAVAEQKQLQGRISEYQRRLNQAPISEQQLVDLQRDYSVSQTNYADLESKRTQASIAARLVQTQKGEQFRIVDPASFPTKPSSPDRRRMGIMGALLGLAVGAALALILEMKDPVFHTDKDISRLFELPFVMGVPLLRTPVEEKRLSRTRFFEWAGGSLIVTAVLAVEVFVFLKG